MIGHLYVTVTVPPIGADPTVPGAQGPMCPRCRAVRMVAATVGERTDWACLLCDEAE